MRIGVPLNILLVCSAFVYTPVCYAALENAPSKQSLNTPPATQAGPPPANAAQAIEQTIIAQSINFSICDSREDSSSWIQYENCEPNMRKVIEWPLLSLVGGKLAPKPMHIGSCVQDPSKPCGFDAKPRYWYIGRLNAKNSPLPLPMPIVLSQSILTNRSFQSRSDELYALFELLETKTAPIELAWRLGSSNPYRNPIFALVQTEPIPDSEVRLGDCNPLPIGTVTLRGHTWTLQSECTPPAGAAFDSYVRATAVGSARSFKWALRNNGYGGEILPSEVAAGEVAHFSLFPYETKTFNEELAKKIPFHLGDAPSPVDLMTGDVQDGPYIVSSLDIPLVQTMRISPRAQNPPDSLPRLGIWAAFLVIVGGIAWFIVNYFRRRKAGARSERGHFWSTLFAKQRSKIEPVQPIKSEEPNPPSKPDLTYIMMPAESGQATEIPAAVPPGPSQGPREEREIQPETSRVTDMEGKIKKLEMNMVKLEENFNHIMMPAESGRSTEIPAAVPPEPSQGPREEREIQPETSRETDMEGKIKKLEMNMVKLEENFNTKPPKHEQWVTPGSGSAKESAIRSIVDQRIEELSPRFGRGVASGDSSMIALNKTIDSRFNAMVSDWSSMLLYDPEAPPAAISTPREMTLQRPSIDSGVEKIVRPMYALSSFARDILRAWFNVMPVQKANLELDPLGKLLVADLKVLEAVVFFEHPLWSWWLGELPPSSQANIVVRIATGKWSPVPGTPQDAARIALRWADDRVPRLQTLIEAAPNEFGSDDPTGLRRAITTAAARFGNPSDTESEAYNLSKASKVFHGIVENLYAASDAQYVPVRLYEDTIQSDAIAHVVNETRSVYPFAQSSILVERRIADRHGMVVRIIQPFSKRRDQQLGKPKWEGSMYILENARSN